MHPLVEVFWAQYTDRYRWAVHLKEKKKIKRRKKKREVYADLSYGWFGICWQTWSLTEFVFLRTFWIFLACCTTTFFKRRNFSLGIMKCCAHTWIQRGGKKKHENKWGKLIWFHQYLHLGWKELIIFQAEGSASIAMNVRANCVRVTHFQLAGGDVAFPSFNAGPAIVLTADGAAMVGMIVPTDRMKSAVVSSSRCFQWEAEQLAGWLLFLGLAVCLFFLPRHSTSHLLVLQLCLLLVSVFWFKLCLLPPLPPTFYP